MSIMVDNLRDIMAAQQRQIEALRRENDRLRQERDIARMELQECRTRAAIQRHRSTE